MNLIFQMIVIAYLFFLVPFYAGILETVFFSKMHRKKIHKKMSEIVTNGYLFMMACFAVLSILAVSQKWPLSRLTMVWTGITVIISVLANIFGQKQIKEFIRDVITVWELRREKSDKSKSRYRLFFILAVFTIVSIVFVTPDEEDRTWEIVHTAVSTDTMYKYDEYSAELSEQALEGHAYAPIEMLYAAGAYLTGMSETVLLYDMMPLCFLFFFYMVLWRLGAQFFKTSEHIENFVLITSVLYWMTIYPDGQSVVTGIFRNSWNGLTLLSCCIMPVALSICLHTIKCESEGRRSGFDMMENLYRIIILILAGQLTNEKGGFYILLMLGITMTIIIARKGYRYGITSGRFKKCV